MKKQSSKKHLESGNYTRRSFISKTALGSAGFLFIPQLVGSNPRKFQDNKDKEEIYKQIDILVNKYFPVYRTCSQTCFHVLNEVFGLESENIVKALASFPGIVMRGETCGAVTASLLAIGLVYEENLVDEERKRASFAPSLKFCSAFENEYGTTQCRDVIEHVSGEKRTISQPEDYGMLAQQGVLNHCPEVVKKTLKTAADIILEKT